MEKAHAGGMVWVEMEVYEALNYLLSAGERSSILENYALEKNSAKDAV